mgnify:CR=1 FL=1
MDMKPLFAAVLVLLVLPRVASAETCVLVGGPKAPLEVQIFDETQQAAEGKLLYSGRINRDQRIPVTVSYLKVRYQYRSNAADPWSPAASDWCQRGESRVIP